MLNIVLFGPPGAGKGTQSEKLISKFQLVHLSTGDILRSEIAAGTQLGIEAKMLMDAGILVPDEVVIEMIRSKIDHNPNARGFIFDGFPRTVAQAEALDRLLAEKNTSIRMMLALEVNDQELTKRLLLRGMESGRPDDQNEGVIRQRIEEYNQKTAPLKQYYSAQNKYRSVNGIGTIEGIFSSLCNVIEPKVLRSDDTKKTSASKAPVAKKEAPKVDRPAVKAAAPAKKEKPATKKAVKKAAPKKAARPAGGKAAPKKTAKKAASKKPVKKAAPKKAASKNARPSGGKVVKKPAKKAAPKKVIKKSVKKSVKKASKPVRPAAGKSAPKKAKKAAPKKAAKKAGKKKK
jgi:adenylate kinase